MPHLTRTIFLMAIFIATSAAIADEWTMPGGCDSEDPGRRVAACSALIDAPDTTADVRTKAFFLRALSYWQLSQRERAIRDYDEAIRIDPKFTPALNNRADAYLRLGRPKQGVADIEQALEIAPEYPIYNITRGQIGQTLGDRDGAMHDHAAAMAFGGKVIVTLYQCGLRLAQLYHGPVDGILRPELHTALRLCVDQGGHCDPVPESATTECPEPTS
jgi:tetratricopeptide (TPR) repeat protein